MRFTCQWDQTFYGVFTQWIFVYKVTKIPVMCSLDVSVIGLRIRTCFLVSLSLPEVLSDFGWQVSVTRVVTLIGFLFRCTHFSSNWNKVFFTFTTTTSIIKFRREQLQKTFLLMDFSVKKFISDLRQFLSIFNKYLCSTCAAYKKPNVY